MAKKPSISVHPLPKADPAAVERFIFSDDESPPPTSAKDAQASKRPAGRASKRSNAQLPDRKDLVIRKSPEGKARPMLRKTVYLPLELGERLERRCFDARQELSAAVAEAVQAWLRGGIVGGRSA
jgi:hypothetical protein